MNRGKLLKKLIIVLIIAIVVVVIVDVLFFYLYYDAKQKGQSRSSPNVTVESNVEAVNFDISQADEGFISRGEKNTIIAGKINKINKDGFEIAAEGQTYTCTLYDQSQFYTISSSAKKKTEASFDEIVVGDKVVVICGGGTTKGNSQGDCSSAVNIYVLRN